MHNATIIQYHSLLFIWQQNVSHSKWFIWRIQRKWNYFLNSFVFKIVLLLSATFSLHFHSNFKWKMQFHLITYLLCPSTHVVVFFCLFSGKIIRQFYVSLEKRAPRRTEITLLKIEKMVDQCGWDMSELGPKKIPQMNKKRKFTGK